MRLNESLRKILSVIATLALLTNSLVTPFTVYAQVDESPTPSATPAEEPTITPDSTTEASPTVEPTQEATVTPEATVETSPITESPQEPTNDQPVETQDTTSENTQPQAPPSEVATDVPSLESTSTPNLPQETGSLSVTLVEDVDLSSILQAGTLVYDASGTPTVVTDKEDYAPTDVVLITGTGFKSSHTYTVEVISTDEPPVDTNNQVLTDSQGNFVYSYQLDGNYRPNYLVNVKDGEVIVASTTFTDSAVGVEFDQCANDAGGSYSPGECKWIGSILQGNNSTYFEGMSVPQRILYQGITTPGLHTVSFSYSYTKGGTHAYDFITSLNQGNGSFSPGITNLNKCDGLTGGDATVCNALLAISPSNVTVPNDPFDSKDSTPGVGSGTTQTQKENWYEGLFGSRQISVHSSNSFSSGLVTLSHSVAADGDTGDSDVNVSLSFNLNNCSAQSPCDLLIFFGGHLAVTGSANNNGSDWGQPLGSSNINGGPYHIKNLKIDGDGGSLDNQIAGADIILPGTIVINKNTTGANGTFNFSSTGGSTVPSNFSITTINNSGTQTFNNVLAGAYTVTETVPNGGFSFSNLVCTDPTQNSTTNLNTRTASINVAPGETVNCTFTNTLQSAHLTLVKTITNDNGGSAAAADWTLSATGPTNISGITGSAGVTNAEVNQGTYTLSESAGPAGYTASTYSCVKNGGGAVVSNSITLAAGDNATCTINNNDQAATLHVVKVVTNDNGGTKTFSDFSFQVNGGGVTPFEGDGQNDLIVSAGTYGVTEPAVTGYATTYNNCSNLVIPNGGSATCTITNNDIQPKLTLTKTVINDNGGNAVVGDFPLFVNATSVVSGVQNGFNAGTYTASETNLSGYTPGTWGGDCASNGSITLSVGDVKSCAITNNDQVAHIVLIKNVTNNNGGSAGANDFGLTVAGSSVTSGSTTDVNSNTPIALNETGLVGYDFVSITGDAKCPSVLGGTVTLNEGETVTCTINNDDQAAHLIVIKHVVTDNGGIAIAGDFTMAIDSVTASDGNSFPGSESGVNKTLTTVGSYNVTESGPSGYSASYSSDCSGTIALGQTKTCTITNDDNPASLTLVKQVTNDDGGSAVATDWTLTATGPTSISGAGGVTNGPSFSAGTYTLSESAGPSGYSASAWVCIGGNQNGNQITVGLGESATCTITNDDQQAYIIVDKTVINDNGGLAQPNDFLLKVDENAVLDGVAYPVDPGVHAVSETSLPGYTPGSWGTDCNANGSVTVALGQTKTCTITNDDQPGTLIVKKIVINDNGGTKEVDDFSFQINGANTTPFEVDGQNDLVVNAGTYNITELSSFGYNTSYDNCLNVEVANGGTATCTITNDDQTRGVNITKSNDKSGGASAGDTVNYTLTITNTGEVVLTNIVVKDVLPGGFSYVTGSSNIDGSSVSDPSISGNTLSWSISSLGSEDSATITYQAKIDSDLTDGTYTNFATCQAQVGGLDNFIEQVLDRVITPDTIDCNTADSSVTLGHTPSFGGNLVGQVLGASTELPATGSPTALLLVSLGLLGAGLILKGATGKSIKRTSTRKSTKRKSSKKRKHAKK